MDTPEVGYETGGAQYQAGKGNLSDVPFCFILLLGHPPQTGLIRGFDPATILRIGRCLRRCGDAQLQLKRSRTEKLHIPI